MVTRRRRGYLIDGDTPIGEEGPMWEEERKREELKDIRTSQASTEVRERVAVDEMLQPIVGPGDAPPDPANIAAQRESRRRMIRESERREVEREEKREELRGTEKPEDRVQKALEGAKAARDSARAAKERAEAAAKERAVKPYTPRSEMFKTPKVLLDIERGFESVSGGLRETARGLRERGRAKREPLPQPGEIIGLPGPGQRPRPGGIEEVTGLAIRAGASAFDAFTMPVRPILVAETIHTTAKLVTDVKTRKAFLRSAAQDPAGIGADILGGAIGGYALGYGIGKVRQVYTRRRYLTDLPDEAFLHPDDVRWGKYPQQVDVERLTIVGKESVRVVDDLGAGFLDSHQVKVGTLPPQGIKTLDLRMGKEALSNWEEFAKGYYRTGHDLIPSLVPKGAGKVETVYRFGLEHGTAFRPAVRLPLRPGVIPGPPLALTTGLGVLSSLKAPEEITRPEELITDVVEEARIMTGGTTRVRARPKPTPPGFIEAPRVIQFGGYGEKEIDLIAPMYRPPRQVQRRRQRQGPIMDVPVDVAQREIETPPELLFSWPTTYKRPRDTRPIYRPEMAKDALKRGRGSWRWFGEFRQYLKGDPLKVLEGL